MRLADPRLILLSILPLGTSLSPIDRAMCRLLRGFHYLPANIQGWTCFADIPNDPVCTWTGVVCTNGVITELTFGNMLPSTATSSLSTYIGVLTTLQSLQLFQNGLHGTIPSEIGYLSSLENLQLQENHFTGTLPTTLCNLSSLQVFLLNSNPNITCSPSCLYEPSLRNEYLPHLVTLSLDSTTALCTGPTISPTSSPSKPTYTPTHRPTSSSISNTSDTTILSTIGSPNGSISTNVLIPIIVAAIACVLIACCVFMIHRAHVREVQEEAIKIRRISIQEENKARRRSSLLSKSQIVADI